MTGIFLKSGGFYANPSAVFCKKSGVYAAVQGVFCKSSGTYGSNLLFSPAELFVGGYAGAFYDASDIASLYQDSAGATAVTAAGQVVGRISDKSGNGLHAIQATAGARPAWSADASGRMSLSFDGVDDMLQNATVNITAYPVTVAIAVRYPAPAASTSMVSLASSGSADWRTIKASNSGSSNVEIYERASGRNRAALVPVDSGHVIIAEWTASDVFSEIDGEALAVNTTDYATFGSGVRIALGQDRAGVGSFYSGRIHAAVIINKSLSAGEKAKLRQFLGAKAGAPMLPFAAIGDSFTEGVSGANGVSAYPYLVAASLRAAGTNLRSLNCGIGGHTSSQMYSRISDMTASGVPTIAAVYAGMNDTSYGTTVSASPSPTTSTFSVASGLGAKFGTASAGGYIKVNGVQCKIASVSTDAITLDSPLGFTPVAGQAVIHDTQKNIERMVAYLQTAGCSKLLVIGIHYWNMATGDTTSTQHATVEGLRTKEAAAAAASSVPYVDLYALMRQKIVAGTVVQNDWSVWHQGAADPHLNVAGQLEVAAHVLSAIQAQGWG